MMAAKVNRVLAGALAVSLAIHLLLIGTAPGFGLTPEVELVFPIEASLALPPPVAVPPPAAPPHRSRPVEPAPSEPASRPPAPVPVESAAPPSPPELPSVPPPPAPVVTPPAPPPAAPAMRPALRRLPEQLLLHYAVMAGEGGFVAGRANYVWRSRDGRYALSSTLEAAGVASLFISGRIVQVSEGTVDRAGLHPALYSLQRNERRQDVARFDWNAGRLVMEGRGEAVPAPQAQDLLSFPFHLAMTVREGEPDFTLGVSNGRKYNEYAFRVLGNEPLELAGQTVETLHLRGEKPGEGSLDVWLDLGRTGLPVRVRTLDRKGNLAEMRLEGMETPERGSGDQP